jgi:CDP-diacylglycerol--serine O-phosphatidyltransferase
MISNVRYWSFKTINLKKSVPSSRFASSRWCWHCSHTSRPVVLFGSAVGYALPGYVTAAWSALRPRARAAPS